MSLRAERTHYDYDNRMLDGNTRDDGSACGFGGCLYTRPADRDGLGHDGPLPSSRAAAGARFASLFARRRSMRILHSVHDYLPQQIAGVEVYTSRLLAAQRPP